MRSFIRKGTPLKRVSFRWGDSAVFRALSKERSIMKFRVGLCFSMREIAVLVSSVAVTSPDFM